MFRFLLIEWRRFLLWCELKAANPHRSYTVTAVDEDRFIIGERRSAAEKREWYKQQQEEAVYFRQRREALRKFASPEELKQLDAQEKAERVRWERIVQHAKDSQKDGA